MAGPCGLQSLADLLSGPWQKESAGACPNSSLETPRGVPGATSSAARENVSCHTRQSQAAGRPTVGVKFQKCPHGLTGLPPRGVEDRRRGGLRQESATESQGNRSRARRFHYRDRSRLLCPVCLLSTDALLKTGLPALPSLSSLGTRLCEGRGFSRPLSHLRGPDTCVQCTRHAVNIQ